MPAPLVIAVPNHPPVPGACRRVSGFLPATPTRLRGGARRALILAAALSLSACADLQAAPTAAEPSRATATQAAGVAGNTADTIAQTTPPAATSPAPTGAPDTRSAAGPSTPAPSTTLPAAPAAADTAATPGAVDATDNGVNSSAGRPPPRATPAAGSRRQPALTDYTSRPEVRAFINDMVERQQFDRVWLEQAFRAIRFDARVIQLMAPTPTTARRSWSQYRARFLDRQRIDDGVAFWERHAEAIRRAALQYGVPEEIMVSIIGVETLYGRMTGQYRVIDSLTMLSFDYARRADYFRGELEQFLLYVRSEGIAPESVLGSFAGAIGLPQFMPTSLRRYAVDFDANGHIDLRGSPVDAVGSVAHFLAEHGWRPGEPVRYRVAMADEAAVKPLIDGGIEPRLTLGELAAYGLSSPDLVAPEQKLALIDLIDGEDPTVYYLGTPNFYVITRYNRSSYYAMAVYELGEALRAHRAARKPGQAGNTPIDR